MECSPFSVDQHWSIWESAAADLRQADRYCSSPYWGLPLLAAFALGACPMVYRYGSNLAVLYERDVPGGRLHLPCDFVWCLGNPFLGPDPAKMLEALCEHWEEQGGVHQLTVGGLYRDSPVWRSPLWHYYPSWELPAAGRQVASLEGGVDGFLSRRSVNFRSRLRRAVNKVEQSGVEVEYFPHKTDLETTLHLLERALRIETMSWKGQQGQGIDSGSMTTFYRSMLPLLAQNGNLRGLFLRRDGRDVSYLFGAAFAGYFRGLQFSYLQSEPDSLGNVGQWKMICALVEEGCHSYDLGQAMAYKSRWAEQKISSLTRGLQVGSQGFDPGR